MYTSRRSPGLHAAAATLLRPLSLPFPIFIKHKSLTHVKTHNYLTPGEPHDLSKRIETTKPLLRVVFTDQEERSMKNMVPQTGAPFMSFPVI